MSEQRDGNTGNFSAFHNSNCGASMPQKLPSLHSISKSYVDILINQHANTNSLIQPANGAIATQAFQTGMVRPQDDLSKYNPYMQMESECVPTQRFSFG